MKNLFLIIQWRTLNNKINAHELNSDVGIIKGVSMKFKCKDFETNKKIFESILNRKLSNKTQQLVECIYHQDNTASLSINLEKGLYYCHACGMKGSTIVLSNLYNCGGG